MDKITATVIGILIPFLGTTLGAAMAFFLKSEMSPRLQKALLGFASGVMIAASVWSLLIPGIELAETMGQIPWLSSLIGFLTGVIFLLFLDSRIPHLHIGSLRPEGKHSKLTKSVMLILAVTLHNLPEGMAVGVVFAGMLSDNAAITVAGAFALSVGIAIQNFPEGAIISLPLVSSGRPKFRSFLCGFLSGIVEPVGAVFMILLTTYLSPLLPFILAFAAGAMIYVVVEELIPEAQSGDETDIGTIGCALGFSLMMVLDVALG